VILQVLTIVFGVAVILWAGPPYAHGQKATEVFIPVGQSPGLSNVVTVVGTIDQVNPQGRTVAVVGPAGSWRATITERTKVWLDRSKLRLTNQKGTFADLKKGLLVEVKYETSKGRSQGQGPAEWVKVQVPESGATSGQPRP
jgi:hypothetical protein